MRISDIKVWKLSGSIDWPWEDEERSVAPLDIYPPFDRRDPPRTPGGRLSIERYYVTISTDEGVEGLYGPIVYEEQADLIARSIRPRLLGEQALEIERIWDQLRADRHGRNGYYMMAISAIDNALWDLRGKAYGAPVFRLLGGPTRQRIPVYASTLGFSVEPGRVAARAKALAEEGYAAQKWFFRYGPGSGGEGRARNVALAREVREAIGPDREFMLDCWMGWDVPYALDAMDRLSEFRPLWLEEPLLPNQLDGYRTLKERGGLPIAAGEHLYTRKEFKPFLDGGLLQFAQPDPDWTGGITELRKIAVLAETFDVKFVPHGCTVVPNAHVIASLPPSACPYLEYLVRYQLQQNHFHKNKFAPKDGFLTLPEQPGLGIEWDESAIERKQAHR